MKKIVICGNYGINNLGDEAILDGLIRLIKSTYRNAHIIVLSSDPINTIKQHKVESVYMFPAGIRSLFSFLFKARFWATMDAVATADLVILGGGGLLTDENKHAIWIWYSQFFWFKLFGRRFVCLAQSVGPIKKNFSKFLVRNIYNYSKISSVRDQKSKEVLIDIGVKTPVEVLSDPAFALAYDGSSFHKPDKSIVLSIRPWKKENSEFILEIAKFVEFLVKEEGYIVNFIPFQKAIADDSSQYRKIKDKSGLNDETFKLIDVNDFRQALDYISRADMIFGMRLHSVIFSIIARKPFLAISYSPKVKNLLLNSNLKCFLDLNNVNLKNLKSEYAEIKANHKNITMKLEQIKLNQTYGFFNHEALLKEVLE
ncbi:hypothetical protein GF376_03830 [Candidatus Peregrinibacteria bacterium]|nr:hypothetical protein [Candidatus Peregrinibacteria bacterium]